MQDETQSISFFYNFSKQQEIIAKLYKEPEASEGVRL